MNRKAREFLEQIGYEEKSKSNKPNEPKKPNKSKKEKETVKLLNKHNFSISSLCPKADRYDIQEYVHITDRYSEVTNGHYLCRVTTQDILKSDLPTNNGLEPLEPIEPSNETIELLIDKDSAKKVQQNIPKNTRNFQFLNSTWIGKNTDKERVEFIITDITDWTPITVRKQEGKFPDTEAIIKHTEEKPIIELGFNPNYMKGLCEQVTKMGITGVSLSIYGKDKAMKIKGKTTNTETGGEQEITILLMPMKV